MTTLSGPDKNQHVGPCCQGGLLTDVLGFFFMPLGVYWGPGTQLTTAGIPPRQKAVALAWLNSSGQAARCTSVPTQPTEWSRKTLF